MSLPKKYKISKKDAILGATTSFGFPKELINPDIPVYSELYEFIELLNNHKPVQLIICTNLDIFFKTFKKDLKDYINKNNLYIFSVYNSIQNKTYNTIWKQPKYTKQALLLSLNHYGTCIIPKNIIDKYHIEVNKFTKSLNLSENIIDFIYNYISGYLLGYRKNSIKGFYLLLQYYNIISNNYPNIKELIKNKNEYLIQLKNSRKIFQKSPLYNIYKKEYPIFVKKCDKWIKYILNDSQMFKNYFDIYKHKIELFSPTN